MRGIPPVLAVARHLWTRKNHLSLTQLISPVQAIRNNPEETNQFSDCSQHSFPSQIEGFIELPVTVEGYRRDSLRDFFDASFLFGRDVCRGSLRQTLEIHSP